MLIISLKKVLIKLLLNGKDLLTLLKMFLNKSN
jgi:hypothetical protein